jgi:hypothetical protein
VGGVDCVNCIQTPPPPEKTIAEITKSLEGDGGGREQNIMADLDQMRELTCGSKLKDFADYKAHWNKKYDQLKTKGKLRSRIDRKKLFAIDSMARTMYGELLWPKMCTDRHWMAWSRIVYNRAQDEKNGLGYAWAPGGTYNKPLEDIVPLIVSAIVNSRRQFDVWKPGNKNLKKMGCVLNSEDWDKMTVISARTILDNGNVIKAMTNGNRMDNARCYYSGVINSLDPCKGNELLDVEVNGKRLIVDPKTKSYQCLIPQRTRDISFISAPNSAQEFAAFVHSRRH